MARTHAPAPIPSPDTTLESALVDEYLQSRGVDGRSVESLADAERTWLLRDAALYAATRLAEIQARADVTRACGTESRRHRKRPRAG
jgi:hypothetical protein